ncbi:MAG: hypothetical protein WCL50_05855 [Spirochaetota bacterium]
MIPANSREAPRRGILLADPVSFIQPHIEQHPEAESQQEADFVHDTSAVEAQPEDNSTERGLTSVAESQVVRIVEPSDSGCCKAASTGFGLVHFPDGRIRRIVRLEATAGRSIREIEPDFDTDDLASAKEILRKHIRIDSLSTFNAAFTLRVIRDSCLYTQDQIFDFATWLRIESAEIGISVSYAYRLLSMADALDRYLQVTFVGTWKLSIDDLAQRRTKLGFFMSGVYRKVPLETLREQFISGSDKQFECLCMGRKPPTPEQVEATKAARREDKSEDMGPPLAIGSGLEQQIVDAIKVGLIPKVIGLKDPEDARNVHMALIAARYETAEKELATRKIEYFGTQEECRSPLDLYSIEDAKQVLLKNQSEGIPSRLVCAAISAQLADKPALVEQWQALGNRTVYEYLSEEARVPFDAYRYVIIGRNYLAHESKILAHFSIETEVMFSKLYRLDKAIENHGDLPELIWRYFSPDITLEQWNIFAMHKDYEVLLKRQPLSSAKIKEAKAILFEYHAVGTHF